MKSIWRKIFKEYFIGDKVVVPFCGTGKVIEKRLLNNAFLYTVKLDTPYELDEVILVNGEIAPTHRKKCITILEGLLFEHLEECE